MAGTVVRGQLEVIMEVIMELSMEVIIEVIMEVIMDNTMETITTIVFIIACRVIMNTILRGMNLQKLTPKLY